MFVCVFLHYFAQSAQFKRLNDYDMNITRLIVIYLLYWWFFQIIRFGQYQIGGWINIFIERYGFGEDLFDAIFIIN